MKSPKKLMTFTAMAFALLLPACSESRMRADQEQAEVPAGTQLYVRVNQNASDNQMGWKSGDEFQGTLARPLQVSGRVIATEGTIVKGELTNKLDYDTTGTTAGSRTPMGDTRARDNRGVTGDPTMSAGRMEHDRLGLELKKIVLNGEEYDIDTHTVPVPGMMASQNEDKDKADKESIAKAHIAGQEFVFTLADKVDLPATTNMKTE